ncbi:MAG: hypothetical protein ACRDKW_15300 [Actinomycetota bacterium]
MSGMIVVDTVGLTDLGRLARDAARVIGDHAQGLRDGGRDGGRATQQPKLEADYEAAYGRALQSLDALGGSFAAFGRALDQVAEGWARADAAGAGTQGGGTDRAEVR